MKIYTLWAVRKSSSTSAPLPELLLAWDETSVSDWPSGYELAKKKALAGLGEDLLSFREAYLTADDKMLESLFEIPDLSNPKPTYPFGHPPGVRSIS